MAFHVTLLTMLTLIQGVFFWVNHINGKVSFTLATGYNIGDFLVNCMIAFIVWRVCSTPEGGRQINSARISSATPEEQTKLLEEA